MRKLISFVFPLGILAVLSFCLVHFNVGTDYLSKINELYPYVVYAIGLLLGWRFHKVRLVLALLIIALMERSITFSFFSPMFLKELPVGYEILSMFLFVDFFILAMMKDRGWFSIKTFLMILLIISQILFFPVVYHYKNYEFIKYIQKDYFSLKILGVFNFHPLTFFVFIISALFILITYLYRKKYLENGFFWSLILAFVAFNFMKDLNLFTFYMSTSAFVLLLSLIESSYFMAFKDELTGLPSRRALNASMLTLGGKYVIAMVDIDFFKKFNDRYGHETGDMVLKKVAGKISSVTGGGRGFRYGGEEFTILFPRKNVEKVEPHLEALRHAVESDKFKLRSMTRSKKKQGKTKAVSTREVAITISIGVAEPSKKYPTTNSVMKAADKALYKAKKNGRNCICRPYVKWKK